MTAQRCVIVLVLAICSMFAAVVNAALAERPPNIVIIFTDDQGYQDLGCFGSPQIKTPHIDKMATEGMKLTSFYAASVCTPSRAMILTGCYAPRVGMPGVIWPDEPWGIAHDETTFAELAKSKGYATACIGKWHVGHAAPNMLPPSHGFDLYYGVPYSNDMGAGKGIPCAEGVTIRRVKHPHKNKMVPEKGSPLVRGEQVIEHPTDANLITQRYTAEAVKFITANRGKPFLLYLAHTMPHTPLAASAEFKGKSKRGFYGDVIEEIDASTGRILACLKKQGVDDNTVVLFTSDNGPWHQRGDHGGSALPLRGGKTTLWEGGVRVPTVVRWPGKIPANTTYSGMASTMDLLPTIATLIGAKAPTDRVIDGVDMSKQLLGESKAPVRETFYYFHDRRVGAVRWSKWKLFIDDPGKKAKYRQALYDLEADLSETTDVSAKHPEIVAKLTKMIATMQKDMDANARPAMRLKK